MCVNRTEQEEEVMICIPGSQPCTCTFWCNYKGIILCSSSHVYMYWHAIIHVAGLAGKNCKYAPPHSHNIIMLGNSRWLCLLYGSITIIIEAGDSPH